MGSSASVEVEVKEQQTKEKEQPDIPHIHLWTMCENPAIVMTGRRGSGKSLVCKSVIDASRCYGKFTEFNEFNQCVVFSGVNPSVPFGEDVTMYFGEDVPMYDFLPGKLQEELESHQRKCAQADQDHVDRPRLLVVFDDCFYDRKIANCDAVKSLVANHVQYNIGYVFATQHLGVIPRFVTAAADYTLLARDVLSTGWDRWHGKKFPDTGTVQQLSSHLQKWEMLVFDHTQTSAPDRVFRYDALFGR